MDTLLSHEAMWEDLWTEHFCNRRNVILDTAMVKLLEDGCYLID